MNTMRICGKCGAPLPAAAPEGLCPKCLMNVGLGTGTGKADPAAAKERTTAPPPEAIAKHFPQLEIIELLGQGGMVYKARQPQLDRLVALKILSPDLGGDPAFAERFTREARALARLNHPNIVAVYDFGRAGDLYFLLMEYVDGLSLWQMEQAKKPLAPAEALAIVPKICDALQYAHDEGIVHRDIKPGNILLDKKGRVKIADFGLAKLLGRDSADFTLTQSKMMMGTPQYMAPEQMERPLETDHRADIYSLGVVFYEMLTGELPMGRFDPPSRRVQVDMRLDEVVLRSLERDVHRRYQHASEVKTAVESITAGSPASQPAAPPLSQGTARKPAALAWVTSLICAVLLIASFMPWGHTGRRPTEYRTLGPLALGIEPVDQLVNAWDSNLGLKPPAATHWYVHVPNWLVPIAALAIIALTLMKTSGLEVPRWLSVCLAAYGAVHVFLAIHALTLTGYHDAAPILTFFLFVALLLQLVGGWIVERVPFAAAPPTLAHARLAAAALLLCGLVGLSPLLKPDAFFHGPDTILNVLTSFLVVLGVPAGAVITAGALRMLARPASRLALAAGALAMAPCYLGFPLGLPVGFCVLRVVKGFEMSRTVPAGDASPKPPPPHGTREPARSRSAWLAWAGIAALLGLTAVPLALPWLKPPEPLFYTFAGHTEFVKSPNGPALSKNLIRKMGFNSLQVEAVNKILQNSYRDFVSLERQHTEVAKNQSGHVQITINPFPEECRALFIRMTGEIRGIIGWNALPPALGNLHTIGLFRHAGEAQVTAELWRDGATYHFTEQHGQRPIPGGTASLGRRGAEGSVWRRVFPEEYWIYWSEPSPGGG